MGNTPSIKKVGFEDIQYIQKNNNYGILINTLSSNDQKCVITGTISPNNEEKVINDILTRGRMTKIIIYGRNNIDDTIYKKYQELVYLGFKNVYTYPGGIFEWLCLQDIYGVDDFKTNTKEMDILKYKPVCKLNTLLIDNY